MGRKFCIGLSASPMFSSPIILSLSGKKLGITYDALAPLNERLIYASFTGYGETGEEASKPGFDTTAWWARSGLMSAVRESSHATPARSAPGMGDHPSSLALYSGIVMALYKRQITGKGTEVSSSLLANGVWANGFLAQAALCGASFHDRPPRESALNALGNYYRCRDGAWLILSIHNEEKQWPEFLRCLERTDLMHDERFLTKPDRLLHASALTGIFDEAFAQRDRAEWRTRLNARNIISDIVALPGDIVDDKQMRDNAIVIPFADGAGLTVNSPVTLRGETKVEPRLPPDLGQHNDEILCEIGFDAPNIARMRAGKAVS